MATTIWKGQLTFALVSFPVRLYRAARPEKIHFRRLYREPQLDADPEPEFDLESAPPPHTKRGGRVRSIVAEPPPPPLQQLEPTHNAITTTSASRPIERQNLVRGFEVAKDEYVVVEDRELRDLAPETSKEMQLIEFVHLNEIDPIYFETSYFVRPDEAGERPYALLTEAMRKNGYAGVAQLAMHRRDHVVILRPGHSGLIAHTMFYPDEVRLDQEFATNPNLVQKKELDLAVRLIDTMVTAFDPSKFQDTYRAKLAELIESRKPAPVAKKPPVAAVNDILASLQKSLAQTRKAG